MNNSLHHWFHRMETHFDEAKFLIKKRLNRFDPIVIETYRGYGNHEAITVLGRVLEDDGLIQPQPEDSVWQNLVATARRLNSDEIPFVRVAATFQGQTQITKADDEGYFRLTLPVDSTQLDPAQRWHPVYLRLLDQVVKEQKTVTATAEVLIPHSSSEFGVISDIDDTVLVSDTARLMKMLRLALMENAHSRLAFPGVAPFYRALQQGATGQSHNPFFYVSSSPWNLYDLLTDFFKIHQLPRGPVLLRDLGISEKFFIKEGHGTHKLRKIRHILNTLPTLPFVLIGDSGQHDPEIYQQIVQEFPGRIRAIYIRDVSQTPRDAQVAYIADALAHEVDLVYCTDSEAAAQHALQQNLITSESLPEIHTASTDAMHRVSDT